MKSLLRRTLAGAATTVLVSGVLLAGAAAPAHAESSTYCPQSSSTRLLTVNDGQHKLWVYQPSSNEVYVCFATYYAQGVLVFRTGLSGTLVPTVTPETNDENCPSYVHVQDPIDLLLRFGGDSSGPYYLCSGVGSSAVRVTVTAASGSLNPSPELWLDRHTYASDRYCITVAPNNPDCENWSAPAVRVI